MLQDSICHLIDVLHQNNYQVQIESNGDRLARGFTHNKAMLVVSPKITPVHQVYKRLSEPVFKRVDALKFVVEADKESPYHTLPEYVYEWVMYKQSAANVFVSPITEYAREVSEGEIASVWTEGLINKEKTAANYAYAASLCIKYGYSLSCQTHTFTSVE